MLEGMTLESLGRTHTDKVFCAALEEVEKSLLNDADIAGKRKIVMTITFEPNPNYVATAIQVETKTPRRAVKAIAALSDDGRLEIDTVTGNALHGSMFDAPEYPAPKTVVKMIRPSEARAAGGQS